MVDTNSYSSKSSLYDKPNAYTMSPTGNLTQSRRNDDKHRILPNKNYTFTIYHQNIQGLKGKNNEIILTLLLDLPHIICLTEHHVRKKETDTVCIPNYELGAQYSRTFLQCGGACIYIHENIKYTKVEVQKYCKEQDIELSAIKLKMINKNAIFICLYRAPTGNFEYFLNQLDNTLSSLLKPKTEFIICGDFSINFSDNNTKKMKVENLLNTYNLRGTVQFPTRITNSSSTTTDNIFTDKNSRYIIEPHTNGLADHDTQTLKFTDLTP